MKPIPLFGEGVNAYSSAVSAQRRLNCYYDVRKDGDKNTAILRGTPGSVVYATVPLSPIRGWREINEVLYIVAGTKLYSHTAITGFIELGVITTSNTGFVDMTDNTNQLGIVDGVGLWVYTLKDGVYAQSALNTAGSFGVVTDANFPNGAQTITFMSGYVVVEKPNTLFIYISAPNGATDDMTNWTNVSSLPNYVIKNDSSDYVSAVDSINGLIVVWGSRSIEFFQNVGTSPNPFARVTGSSQTWGLAALWSRQYVDYTMMFIGQNLEGGIQVMKLDGYVPKRVSNSDIENLITSFPTFSDATSISYMEEGHPMYQLNFPSADRSLLFDALTGAWQEVQTGVGAVARHFAELSIPHEGKILAADSSSGTIYQFDNSVYTDNGVSIKRQAVTRHINNGGNLFGVAEVLLDMETGVGLQSGQGSDPQLVMEVSKDGGRTWGQERWATIGAVGSYLTRAVFRRLGMGRDYVFRFTMTDPVKFTIIRGSLAMAAAEGKDGS